MTSLTEQLNKEGVRPGSFMPPTSDAAIQIAMHALQTSSKSGPIADSKYMISKMLSYSHKFSDDNNIAIDTFFADHINMD